MADSHRATLRRLLVTSDASSLGRASRLLGAIVGVMCSACYASHAANGEAGVADSSAAEGPDLDAETPPALRRCAAGSTCDCRAVDTVPAGIHWQGYNERRSAAGAIHVPLHRVEFSRSHFLARYEATAACYQWCRFEGACRSPRWSPPPEADFESTYRMLPRNYFRMAEYADLPIFDLTLEGAREYCEWLGGRLPTDVEWEKAARGESGRAYPWSEDPPRPIEPGELEGRFLDPCDYSHNPFLSGAVEACLGVDALVIPVASFPEGAGPYGHFDLVGNVAEWVADSAVPYPAAPGAIRVDPGATVVPWERAVYRGAAHLLPHSRVAAQGWLDLRDWYPIGVRCAFDEMPEPFIYSESP